MSLEEVKKLLIKHNYIVSGIIHKDYTAIFHFPAKKENPSNNEFFVKYQVDWNGKKLLISCGESYSKTFDITDREFALKSAIIINISSICKHIGFDPTLINYYNNEYELISSYEFIEKFNYPEYNEKDMLLENTFSALMIKYIQ